MSDQEKHEAFVRGEFELGLIPPVCLANWGEAEWIKWIDAHDGWNKEGR